MRCPCKPRDALLQRKIRSSHFVLRILDTGVSKKNLSSAEIEDSVGDRRAGGCAPSREKRVTCVAIGIRNHPRERIADPMVHIVRRCQVSEAVEEPEDFCRFTVYRLPLSKDPSPSREIEVIIVH
jgi:hypothetical protein